MDYVTTQWHELVTAFVSFHLTPWKLVGFLGMALFTSRWFVQLYFTRKRGRVVMPQAFWWLSVCGSTMLLAYFILGKNDSVGILSNLFPMFVASYNLLIHSRQNRHQQADSAAR